MTARSGLRAVKDGEASTKRAHPQSVAQAATNGTTRDLLVAVRDRIAETVSDAKCPPRDLAALTKRLADVVREIEAIDARAKQEDERAAAVEDEGFDASAI